MNIMDTKLCRIIRRFYNIRKFKTSTPHKCQELRKTTSPVFLLTKTASCDLKLQISY